MPNSGVVVSDTSPLLNLALIERLDLLRNQFSDVTVPRGVWNELTEGEEGLDALRELRDDEFLSLVEVERSDLFVEVFHELDRGETAAICYAVEHGADLVLLDERDGRRVARRHDLEVTRWSPSASVAIDENTTGPIRVVLRYRAWTESPFGDLDHLFADVVPGK